MDSAGAVYITGANPSSPPGVDSGWVLKETPSNGGYTQSVVASGFVLDTGVTADGNGSLFITDSEGGPGYKGLAYKETPSGTSYIQTTIGNNLSTPWATAVDGSGNVYIINFGTGQVIKEDFSDAAAVRFAATAVGQTSSNSPQTVTIENIGNAVMNVPLPLEGTNPLVPSGFVVNDNADSACPFVDTGSPAAGALAVNASCNLTISYSPESSSDTSGWLTYTYDGPNETSSSYQTALIPLIAGNAQLTPAITWSNPSSIVFGTALGVPQLNASANEPGALSYSPGLGTILTVGSHILSVSFTPSDTADFNTAADLVTITVTQATPSISWATPSAITYGTTLSAAQLSANSPVAGTFSYSPVAGTVLPVGSQTLTVTFTPTDSVDYTQTHASALLTVNKATPTITWTTPAEITYGTTLSGAQLDARATNPVNGTGVAGIFDYTPPSGTLLGAGTHTLSVTFTPNDLTDYISPSKKGLSLTVMKARQTIDFAAPKTPIVYGAKPISLSAKASSGLSVTFAVISGPAKVKGDILTVTGAGTIKVAARQAGNDDYDAAPEVTHFIVVDQAKLAIAADDLTMKEGSKLPRLSYTITGFVNGDSQKSATIGEPKLTTNATSTSKQGVYPITVTQGTLDSKNYKFRFENGTLTVVK